jgi:enoyl-CoA hydratase/carnithine racemase
MASILTKLTSRATGKIAQVTISRPAKLNALNSALLAALPQTLSSLTTRHPDLLAVILTGAGPKAFVGGADLAEMAALESPASARAFITRVHGACDAVRECPVPVIARVNGFALGAGLELAASCDLRVAREGAVFGMPEVSAIFPYFLLFSGLY